MIFIGLLAGQELCGGEDGELMSLSQETAFVPGYLRSFCIRGAMHSQYGTGTVEGLHTQLLLLLGSGGSVGKIAEQSFGMALTESRELLRDQAVPPSDETLNTRSRALLAMAVAASTSWRSVHANKGTARVPLADQRPVTFRNL